MQQPLPQQPPAEGSGAYLAHPAAVRGPPGGLEEGAHRGLPVGAYEGARLPSGNYWPSQGTAAGAYDAQKAPRTSPQVRWACLPPPAPVPPYVDAALARPAQGWVAPPLPPSQIQMAQRVGYASQMTWNSTLNTGPSWTTSSASTSSSSWTLPPPAVATPVDSPSAHLGPSLAPGGNPSLQPSSAVLPFPPSPYSQLPSLPPRLPAPPFPSYEQPPPRLFSAPPDAAGSPSWGPVPSVSSSSAWTVPPLRPPGSSRVDYPVQDTSTSAFNSGSATAASSSNQKGKGRARQSSKASAASLETTSTFGGGSCSPLEPIFPPVDDEDDYYPLWAGASAAAGGKPKKPRRKRRKMNEPPRDLAQRKYVCELCTENPKSFARPSALRIHMLTHTKEKPHLCPTCFRSFAIVSNLKRHQRLHENENSSLYTSEDGAAVADGPAAAVADVADGPPANVAADVPSGNV
ncbi:hypothetical protein JCM10213v2_005771 [Rhodosporidiobolus nylandii]